MICPLGLFIIESNNERTDNEMENAVTKREKISYGLYFMGQNVFYGLYRTVSGNVFDRILHARTESKSFTCRNDSVDH